MPHMSRLLVVTLLASSLPLAACSANPASRQINFLREPPAKEGPQRKELDPKKVAEIRAAQKAKDADKDAAKEPKK